MGALDDRVLVELHRAAVLARRPGIVVVSADARRADAVTGSRARTHQAIRRLAATGRALAVRRDLLVLRNDIGVAQAGLLDLVDAISPDGYLVTGSQALHVHGLAAERPAEAVILTPRPVAGFEWGRGRVRYLTVGAERIWGGERLTGNLARPGPVVAGIERALLDAIAHGRFGVPVREALSALATAVERDPGLAPRLAQAAARYGSASVARRVGVLVERVAGEAAAAPFLDLAGTSPTPVLLRPGGRATGTVDRKWRVRLNAELPAR